MMVLEKENLKNNDGFRSNQKVILSSLDIEIFTNFLLRTLTIIVFSFFSFSKTIIISAPNILKSATTTINEK